jgi:hypothetical protein
MIKALEYINEKKIIDQLLTPVRFALWANVIMWNRVDLIPQDISLEDDNDICELWQSAGRHQFTCDFKGVLSEKIQHVPLSIWKSHLKTMKTYTLSQRPMDIHEIDQYEYNEDDDENYKQYLHYVEHEKWDKWCDDPRFQGSDEDELRQKEIQARQWLNILHGLAKRDFVHGVMQILNDHEFRHLEKIFVKEQLDNDLDYHRQPNMNNRLMLHWLETKQGFPLPQPLPQIQKPQTQPCNHVNVEFDSDNSDSDNSDNDTDPESHDDDNDND